MPPRFPAGPPDGTSSIELLARHRAGDEAALDELYARYLPRLRRWAHGRLPAWARASDETRDLVQDTLIHVFNSVDRFQPQHEGAFQAYMRRALYTRICDVIRSARRRPAAELLDSAVPSSEPSPLEQAIGAEALGRYEAALSRLSESDQQAIIARCEMGMTIAEVATALGKPSAAAAHMAVSRALVRLAEAMRPDATAPARRPSRAKAPGRSASAGRPKRRVQRR